jgi:L-asparagine transporter-like permease
MSTQNYSNHVQLVTSFHKVTLPIVFLTIIGAGVNLYQSWGDHERMYSASLIFVLAICLFFTLGFGRVFALKAQDRAIRAEENLRHFAMTGKLLDGRLSVKQIVALRFASDDEFVALARKAADESMAPDAIKRAVKNWRADEYRV